MILYLLKQIKYWKGWHKHSVLIFNKFLLLLFAKHFSAISSATFKKIFVFCKIIFDFRVDFKRLNFSLIKFGKLWQIYIELKFKIKLSTELNFIGEIDWKILFTDTFL